MRPPALVPAHLSLADAARIARRHGFVLKAVRHEGQLRIALVRPPASDAAERPEPTMVGVTPAHTRPTSGD